jgi:hypothetical protein
LYTMADTPGLTSLDKAPGARKSGPTDTHKEVPDNS